MYNRIIGLFLCSLVFMFVAPIQAQTTDLARIEYLNVPSSNGDNSVQRFRVLAQLPIPLDEDRNKLIIVGLDYRQLELEFEDNLSFDPSPFERTRRIEATGAYVWKQPETNWRFGFKAGARIVSNLQRSLVSDDVHWLASVYAINDMRKAENSKPYRWIFGLLYTTAPGRWYPLPLVNYHRDINETWNYTLGAPKTNIRYTFADKKNALQLFAEIDHFFPISKTILQCQIHAMTGKIFR